MEHVAHLQHLTVEMMGRRQPHDSLCAGGLCCLRKKLHARLDGEDGEEELIPDVPGGSSGDVPSGPSLHASPADVLSGLPLPVPSSAVDSQH